jgi:hypothetical protein
MAFGHLDIATAFVVGCTLCVKTEGLVKLGDRALIGILSKLAE